MPIPTNGLNPTPVKPETPPRGPSGVTPPPGNQVSGYCPMGCGQTLFVGAGGYITCARLTCPCPDAVASLLEDQEADHVVAFGLIGFTIRHPLRERLGDALMGCDLHAWCADLPGQPGETTVRMRENGHGGWEVIR